MITETLFQFIWRYSLYNPSNLKTSDGDNIIIIHPGSLNTNAGPDFEEAKIKIGNTTLVGNVELHLKTSDWKKHRHDKDEAYKKIILHVVYEDDLNDNSYHFPKLELHSHIPSYVIEQYTDLLQTPKAIPCATQLHKVPHITKESWLSRMLAERWELKLQDWKHLLKQSKGDWSTLLYWRLAANFGFKVNAIPFLELAQSLPVQLYAKHKNNLLQIEALMFGQAGMLEKDFYDEYPRTLQNEYNFLKKKFGLKSIPIHHWKFLRIRPANFPTIRIAQFATLVYKSLHLFSKIIETTTLDQIKKLLDVPANSYWDNHYRFDEEHEKPHTKNLGKSSIDNIIVNTIAPLQFLFAHQQGNLQQQENALVLLNDIAPEKNKITTLWEENCWGAISAAQSQALVQLYTQYCCNKRCLECAIGLNIIKN